MCVSNSVSEMACHGLVKTHNHYHKSQCCPENFSLVSQKVWMGLTKQMHFYWWNSKQILTKATGGLHVKTVLTY